MSKDGEADSLEEDGAGIELLFIAFAETVFPSVLLQ